MIKQSIKYLIVLVFIIEGFGNLYAQLSKDDWQKKGRGIVKWNSENVETKDCFIHHKNTPEGAYSITFEAMTPETEQQVQIWSGFNFSDRDNRYSLGLRGGNSNDLYLCKYKSIGEDKPLAIVSLDFDIVKNRWYKFRVLNKNERIIVYLNDETQPRINIKVKNHLPQGKPVLGGGWINTVYRNYTIKELSDTEFAKFDKDVLPSMFIVDEKTKEINRVKARKKYKPLKIRKVSKQRTEVSLEGNWLFMPEYSLKGESPQSESLNDNNWHVMEVPQFWNPVRNWLHGQDSGLPHWGSGISDNYREKEMKRCNSYTFDYKKTNAAWYRHTFILPKKAIGKKIKLHFDAVSKVADVYVNGKYAGGHVGMFGDFVIDITDKVKVGKNMLAVNVKVRKFKKSSDADKNVARAVSVDINNDMLKSLPHGMFGGTEGGIWQPVKLVITNDIYIDDVFAKTNTKGGDFEVTVKNNGSSKSKVDIAITIKDLKGKKLYSSKDKTSDFVKGKGVSTISHSINNIAPKLWSPETPNLYKLETYLYKDGKLIDKRETTIGFRTFTVKGNQFLLNGHPYWLRGANHPPCGIAANDKELANKFFKLMHDGNQMITRSHGSPFTKAWMDAADRQGIGVSFEGSWPWLMIGDIPNEELLKIWKEEMYALAKKYRNHPSMLVWTMNNEMYFTMFYHNDPKDIRIKKWKYLTEIIKGVREILVPGTPISADSGYDRLKEDWEKNLKPNGIDDGDVDDRHIYFNWYNRDFFQVIDGEWTERIYWTPGANDNRPFFPQEVSTGYPNNDDGHFCRKYIYKHYVPHAYIGDLAWEDRNPAPGLKRHAFMTKELIEVVRRTGDKSAGMLLFANVCWFKDAWNAKTIDTYPVYDDFKAAMQPILVSAELFGRNFFAGDKVNCRIFAVNNSHNTNIIKDAKVKWSIEYNGTILKSGTTDFGNIDHYTPKSINASIQLPESLPIDRANCSLKLDLVSSDKVLSSNKYEIKLANKSWLKDIEKFRGKKIALFDITGDTKAMLSKLNIPFFELRDLTQMRLVEMDMLIVANLDAGEEVPYSWEDVKKVAGNGTPTLLIHPGKHMQWLMFDKIESIYERKGRIVQMKTPEHKVFNNIDLLDMSWWQQNGREKPRACRRSFRFKTLKDITPLATYLRPHVYLGRPTEQLPEMSGSPLAEIKVKKSKIITSEMELNQSAKDPVAAKLLVNIIKYLLEEE